MADWNRRFFELAKHIGSWSKDRSTQVGAVIANDENRILSVGYNGFPTGCDDSLEHRHQRPQKYKYTEHAERNAIYSAARNGVDISSCTMYIVWFPCSDCTRAIIQSGIKKLVCEMPNIHYRDYKEDFEISEELLKECNIQIEYIN